MGNARRRASKAFVANRVGDLGHAAGHVPDLLGTSTRCIFNDVFTQAAAIATVNTPVVIMRSRCLLLSVPPANRRRFPLYVWLPDAMAGPTPVSALIHAATMVTAGVYLITRSHALYALAPVSANAVALVGAVTALFAATIAVAQFDIKKVLAYSTISQLGFMVAAVGLGAYTAGMFHLVTHAFFKALLFLSAGSVIQGMEAGHSCACALTRQACERDDRTQARHAEAASTRGDMRNMGGLWTRMPVTKWVYLIGALALAGICPSRASGRRMRSCWRPIRTNPVVYWLLSHGRFADRLLYRPPDPDGLLRRAAQRSRRSRRRKSAGHDRAAHHPGRAGGPGRPAQLPGHQFADRLVGLYHPASCPRSRSGALAGHLVGRLQPPRGAFGPAAGADCDLHLLAASTGAPLTAGQRPAQAAAGFLFTGWNASGTWMSSIRP